MDMSNSVQSLGGDNFRVGGQSMDFETLVLSIQSERANLLESQLADQAKTIQDRNALIAQANDVLAKAKAAQNNAAANNIVGGDVNSDNAMTQFFKDNNLSFENKNSAGQIVGNKDQWDVYIQRIKNFTDKLNSSSQMDMIRLQSLMNKRDQAFEMMTNVLQKTSKLNSDIISNMR
ncbi:MAG: hypothetical protein U1F68_00365 [Gammaproteobacteria bacterium]